MIPFARIVKYGNEYRENIVLDIDFSKQNVGDTNIVDWSQNSVFSLAAGTTIGTVEFNADIGTNVMKFNNSRYITAMNEHLSLVGTAFEIRLVLNNNSAPVGEIFCTGDYNGSRIPGMNLSNNPANTAYQMFMDNGNTFSPLLFGPMYNTGWDQVSFKIKDSIITTVVNGNEQTFPSRPYGNGTFFSVASSYTGGTPVFWNGYLQKLTIIKL